MKKPWSVPCYLFLLFLLVLPGIFGPIDPAMATIVTAVNGLNCAGDRATANCTAGEFTVGTTLTNQPGSPTSCVAGDYVTLIAALSLTGTNADRYNVGFFTGENGNDPRVAAAGTCSVATFPTTPLPWFTSNTTGDTCGDYTARGVDNPVVSNIKVLCAGDASGQLMVPYTLVYSQNTSTICTGPIDVTNPSPSKCNAGTAVVSTTAFTVNGSVTVTKKTVPAGDAQSFSFTASGTGPVMSGDGSFSLADNGSKQVRMGISGTNRTLTITEAATALWEPTATIVCTKPDGSSSAGFVTTNGATRTIAATLSNTNPNAVCTITNKRAVSAANSTVVANPTSVLSDGVSTSTITVTLRDTSAAGNPVAGKTVTLTAGSGSSTITTLNGVTDVNGQATFTVKDLVVETVTYTAKDTTDNITITQIATVMFTPVVVVPVVSSFNAVEPGADAVSGKIFTKIAGQNFQLDIVALNALNTIAIGFTGTVAVEVVDNTSGGACSSLPTITAFTNQTFVLGDLGRHSLSSPNTVSDVWPNAKVRIKYPAGSPPVTSCSGDNFAIRPNSLSVSVTDTNWQTAGTTRTLNNSGATGGSVHKAGQPFTLSVTAYNAAAAITGKYAGSPVVQTPACTLPTPTCTNGTLTPGAWTAAGGTVSATATYSEAGSFNLTLQDTTFASVDAADGTPATCAGYYVCSAAVSVGRFVPDHFVVTTNNVPKLKTFNNVACAVRSFTYIGQPFGYVAAPQVLVTAQNASNATTANYGNNLWKLATSAGAQDCTTNPDICTLTSGSVTQTYTYTTSTGALPNWDSTQVALATPTIVAGSNGTGTVTSASGDLLAFKRSLTAPQALFTANITLTDSVKDTSEAGNCGVANCDITALTSAAFNPVAFDSGNEFRFGRLKLSNAFGSEKSDLAMTVQTHYWSGNSWVLNSADSCTSLLANAFFLSGAPAGTGASAVTIASGVGTLTLTKPSPTATGSVDVAANLGTSGSDQSCLGSHGGTAASLPWLRSLNGNCASTYDRDPSARATFGIYAPETKKTVHVRELY